MNYNSKNIVHEKRKINNTCITANDGNPPLSAEVRHCEAWIREYCHPVKYINPRASSYSLKHYAENWQSENVKSYVTNGAFIQAAVNLGYKYRRVCKLNAEFNMYISKSAKKAA